MVSDTDNSHHAGHIDGSMGVKKMTNPPLWEIFDYLSRKATEVLPEYFQDKEVFTNMTFGTLGGTIAAAIISKGIERVVQDKYAHVVEKGMAIGTLILPVTYAMLRPDLKQDIAQHPVYSAGTTSGIVSAAATFNYMAKKSKERYAESKKPQTI